MSFVNINSYIYYKLRNMVFVYKSYTKTKKPATQLFLRQEHVLKKFQLTYKQI